MSDDAKAPNDEPEGEDTETPEDENGEDAAQDNGDASPVTGLSQKLKMIILAVVAVLVLGGGGAGLWFSGVFTTHDPHTATVELPGPPVYYELPQMTVDLKPTPQRARPFIRLQIQIELEGESAMQATINNEPRILDAMQSHLRDTTAEELQGKLGTEQLREDLTTITNRVIAPERAISVRFMRILIR